MPTGLWGQRESCEIVPDIAEGKIRGRGRNELTGIKRMGTLSDPKGVHLRLNRLELIAFLRVLFAAFVPFRGNEPRPQKAQETQKNFGPDLPPTLILRSFATSW